LFNQFRYGKIRRQDGLGRRCGRLRPLTRTRNHRRLWDDVCPSGHCCGGIQFGDITRSVRFASSLGRDREHRNLQVSSEGPMTFTSNSACAPWSVPCFAVIAILMLVPLSFVTASAQPTSSQPTPAPAPQQTEELQSSPQQTTQSQPALSQQERQKRDDWQRTISRIPLPKTGCFKATYPSMEWQEVPCSTATPKRQ
jgi:hypothetical protein